MDTVFFWASKLVWALISPDSLLLILLLTAYGLILLGLRRSGRLLLGVTCLLALLVAWLPLGEWLGAPLESRFPSSPALPPNVDGVIVLGGFIDSPRSAAWQQVQLNEAGERWERFTQLARRYPQARLVVTGGSGALGGQHMKETDSIPALMQQAGLGDREILLETESRNTWENVVLSRELVNPQADEHWLLVTSAAHMPRAVGIFCAQDWPVTPVPVDFRTERNGLWRVELRFAEHLLSLREATHEWVGLLAYFVTGKTARFLPGEANRCVNA
ncbi:MAG: YdcF family protein [Pseudomonadales bacterium]|nr:YdcF family protein [Pseudomonadales bacterium]